MDPLRLILFSCEAPPPFDYVALVLGTVSLVALVLLAIKIYLGLGDGGMERMIAYPIILWIVAFPSSNASRTTGGNKIIQRMSFPGERSGTVIAHCYEAYRSKSKE